MNIRITRILAGLALLIGFFAAHSVFAQVVPTNLWNPNYGSNTITPRPSTLQVPCANIVGGCGGGNVTSTNGLVNTGNVTSTSFTTGTSTATTTINNLNTQVLIPYNWSVTGCPGGFTASDIFGCMQDIYNATVGNASSVHFVVPVARFPVASVLDGNNPNTKLMITGQGDGTQFVCSTTPCGIVVDDSNDLAGTTHRENIALDQFTLIGSTTSLATVPNGTGSSTVYQSSTNAGITLGGTNGAANTDIENITVQGFPIDILIASGTYHATVGNSTIRNGGHNVYINPYAVSGEGLSFPNDIDTDAGNSSATECFYIGVGAVENLTTQGGQRDGCQLYEDSFNLDVSDFSVSNEDTGSSVNGPYPAIVVSSSAAFAEYSDNFARDATTTNTSDRWIDDNGNVTAIGSVLYKNTNAATTTFFIKTDALGSAYVANTVIGTTGAVTNILNSGGILSPELNVSSNNSFALGMQAGSEGAGSAMGFNSGAGSFAGYYTSGDKWAFGNVGTTVGGSFTATTTVDIDGSLGLAETTQGVSSTLNAVSRSAQISTGSNSTENYTLPAINASQDEMFWFVNRGTSSTLITASTTAPDFIHLLTNATATSYTLLPGSTTQMYNDGTYWDQISKN